MTKTTFTVHCVAVLAGVLLACEGDKSEAPPQVSTSTQKKKLDSKTLESLGGECQSAQQPRLVTAPSEGTPEAAVQLKGQALNCGETYELVISAPDGTSTSESLVADAQGKAQSSLVLEGAPGAHDVKLYDSSGEEVAQLSHGSNFRAGHLTWHTVSPRTAEFSLVNVFGRVFPGSGPDGLAVTGDIFQDTNSYTSLCFGDGYCTDTLRYEVTSYDAEQGWLVARALNSSAPQPLPGTGNTVVEAEPNDSFDTANPVQVGDDYSSDLEVSYGVDYARFTLTEPAHVELRTVLVTMGDSYLYLYNGDGQYLASDDDSGEGYASFISIQLEAGTYYVGARGYSSSTGQQLVQLRQLGVPPVGPITHTYYDDGPFTAELFSCCRIDELANSAGGNYRLLTQVGFSLPNSSPVSSLPPLVEAPTRTPDFSFQIPATDAEGDELTFRLANNDESYLWPQPPGLSVSSTGLVSWNTAGTFPGQLWAAQVIIEEHREGVLIGSVPVDFLLRITGDIGAPPTCVPQQSHYTVTVGDTVQFTVSAQDPDAGDLVTLHYGSVPWDATMTPALPLQGPSGISSTFSWKPSKWAAGYVYWASFMAMDASEQMGECTVSIQVQAPANWPPEANAGADQYVSEGTTVTLNGTGSRDEEGEPFTYQWSLVSSTGPAVTLSSVTSATPSFATLSAGVYTFMLTVTDGQGAGSSDTVTVQVYNVTPTVSATGGGVIDEGSTFTAAGSFTDPGVNTWTARVNYGDGTGWQPLVLNGKSFALAHRYANNGYYQVQIAVQDSAGAEGSTSVYVTVRSLVPGVIVAGGTANEGSPFVFSGTITAPGTGHYWWVRIEYGDGSSSSWTYQNSRSFTLSRAYADNGTYTATIRVENSSGVLVTTTTAQVVVHNVAPTVTATVGAPVNEGSRLSFSGSFTDPGSRDTVVIRVDYGDGSPVETVPLSYWYPWSFSMSHRYADNGSYPVTITATDDDGGVGTTTLTAVVNNVAPSVYLEDSWYGSNEGSAMVRRANLYDPGTADTWTATADYGDGTGVQPVEVTSSSFNLSHVYANNGTYTVTLTVRDDDGGVGTATRQVYVYNVAPTVSATGGTVDEGSTLTSSGSLTDPGADTWTARVNYGDNTGWQPLPLNGKSFTLEHLYANSGSYGVSIIVRDSDGAEGSTYVSVTVRNVVPVITATGGAANEGSPFVFSGTFTDPGNESSWRVTVDYGDGSSSQTVSVNSRSFTLSRAYADNGTYTATIRVRDDAGAGTATVQVVVNNVAPTVSATVGAPVNEGSSLYFGGSFTDPGSWDTVVIRVDYGDGSPVETITPSYWSPRSFGMGHRYADSGTYLVTITATDDDGGVGTTTLTAVVNNVAPSVYVEDSWYGSNEGSAMVRRASFYDPGTADTWTATADYGDGTGVQPVEVTSSSFNLSHVYANSGSYTVTLTVRDDDGGVGTATRQVYVYNVAPLVSATGGALDEGSTFTSSGSFTDPGADTWTAQVHYGDGTGWQPLALSGKSFTLEHHYANNGTYWVSIIVRDSDGAEGSTYAYVTVRNVAPSVTVAGGTANEGSPFVFSGTITDPGNESYWWVTIDYGDGSYPQMVYTASRSFTLSRAYTDNGTYTATIRVQDDGGVGTATAQVVVRNVAPTVTATVGGPVNEGSWVYFNGSVTDPGSRDTMVIRVDYGDGSPVETITPSYWSPRSFSMSHRYTDNGLYLATISVTDDDGGVGVTTVPVVVLNVAPAMTTVLGCSPNEGAVCTTGGQFTDPGSDSWTITVNFGDGSAPREISLAAGSPRSYATSHVYDDNGLYTVAVTLTDDDGGSSTFRHLVRVQNVAPTVTAANDSPTYWGLSVNLTGTATDPSQADTQAGFTSHWTLGDGTTGSGLSTAHAYANPGTYWALLTVTDKDGGFNRVPAATAVTIQKRPGALTCQDTTAVFGFPAALSAQFVDGLSGGLPGGRSLSFQLGGSTDLGSATTGATGGASVQSPGELMPGTYPLTVTFAEDSHYTAAEASCTLTVIQSSGTITGGGLRMANHSRGGFNVRFAQGGSVQGELQFQSDTTSFHAHVVSALGLAANNRQGWFAGVGRDGRAFTAYLEDNGEPGSGDVFKLWIDGVLHTGDGAISGGNIQIH